MARKREQSFRPYTKEARRRRVKSRKGFLIPPTYHSTMYDAPHVGGTHTHIFGRQARCWKIQMDSPGKKGSLINSPIRFSFLISAPNSSFTHPSHSVARETLLSNSPLKRACALNTHNTSTPTTVNAGANSPSSSSPP